MRRVSDEYHDRVLIGEAYLPLDLLMAYYGVELRGNRLPFNLQLISAAWQARAVPRYSYDLSGRGDPDHGCADTA